MRFLIDECLTPKLGDMVKASEHYATSIRNLGMLGVKDWKIVPVLIEHNYILVTHNSKDFRGLEGKGGKPGYLTKEEIHPGLICLNAYDTLKSRPIVMKEDLQKQLFGLALDAIEKRKLSDLINTVIEIDYDGAYANITIYEAPSIQSNQFAEAAISDAGE